MLNENLVESFTKNVREHWQLEAYSDYQGRTLTYRDVAHRILELHTIFEDAGVERGDKIAVIGRNSAHWAVTYWATITYGAVIVPILPDFTSDEIHHIVGHSDAVMLFVADPIWDRLDDQRLGRLKAVVRLEDFSLRLHGQKTIPEIFRKAAAEYRERHGGALSADGFGVAPVPGDHLATIVYTSGTTGFSKGVMLQHHSLMVNARFYVDSLDLVRNRRVVSFLPLAHCYGCAFDLISPSIGGGHVTFIDRLPTPKVLTAAFAEIRPTVVLSVPLIIEKIYKSRIKPQLQTRPLKAMMRVPAINRLIHRKIRRKISAVFGGEFQEVVIGGAAFSKEADAFFQSIDFPLANGYGMTECGPLISYSVVSGKPPLGSVGRVIPYLECKIDVVDPEHDVGEVLVRGENVMVGYYKDEEATREAIDQDGWLHTGDLGRLDENGYLFLTGRTKNMILSASGQNVYPEEVEAKLNNLPYVAESLVMECNGRICALIHPDMERADEEGLGEKRLEEIMEQNRAALNEQLPSYAAIIRMKVLYEEFEKTPTKKIKRRLYNVFQ
jgi:long-chain acyl-CoA synthetase